MISTAQAVAATRATYLAFIGAGFAFASWASRIPQVRDRLELDASSLGLVLLAVAAGSSPAAARPPEERAAISAGSIGTPEMAKFSTARWGSAF